jgi:hypothetical protein
MFPLRDSIPSSRPPVVNVLLIAACAVAFVFELSLGSYLERFLRAYAFVPVRLFNPALFEVTLLFNVRSAVLSMFLHGGWLHLIGNMWFLWIFGDNVEDYFGHAGYLFFYLVCGIGSGLVHVLFNLSSPLPAIGASGAISGVMGAYALLFPRNRILTFFFIFLIPVPAFLILGYWFVLQFLAGVGTLGGGASGGVAFWAHIGGFLLGMGITAVVRRR